MLNSEGHRLATFTCCTVSLESHCCTVFKLKQMGASADGKGSVPCSDF